MTDRIKNILIGLFVLAAFAIGAGMLFFLKPQIGDGKKILRVRFANISGIAVGTRVTFAGKPVGEVIHIREITDARDHPDASGKIYFYELILKTDSSVEVYANDEISLRSTGLMGERSVAILPKAVAGDRRVSDEVIYASTPDSLENSFQQVAKVASRLDGMIGRVDSWFQENSAPLSSSIHHVDELLSQMEGLARSVSQGEGNLGKLFETEDLYLHLNSLLSKAETMMNDINHYGILFQYNKGWQRTRTRKANLITALQTPEEFRAYFLEEVDGITASLGRLSLLLERVKGEGKEEMSEGAFKEEMASLLRNVQSLADSLKLYNESLQTKQVTTF
ncbi:MAG: MCE family protein [Verrucomicrobiota bacterium]|nr:MCE family protein [Verrucomicrobiota bacterium]